jgi:hypothetical protein
VDTVNITSGKVAHPKGMRPPDVDASRSQEWQSEPNATIDGRRYDSVVDRETQILWPGDPEFKGYTRVGAPAWRATRRRGAPA